MAVEPSDVQIWHRLAARYPLLLVVTHEEQRALATIVDIARTKMRNTYDSVWAWSFGTGWKEQWNRAGTALGEARTLDPIKSMEFMREKKNALFILKDFVYFISGPMGYQVGRALRDVIDVIETDSVGNNSSIIMLDAEMEVPVRLEKLVHVIDFDLPRAEYIRSNWGPFLVERARARNQDEQKPVDTLVKTALGLTEVEIRLATGLSIAVKDDIDAPTILGEKKAIIRKSGVLEYFDTDLDLNAVGGLGNLKDWLRLRARAFSDEAVKQNIPTPRAALLLGVPGTGKSLVAKAIGREWHMPVVKMDIGALFGGVLGQTEGNLRRAIKTLEAISPCCAFIDEIEKGLSHGGLDGGTSKRLFGSLLSWLNDKTAPVFVIATANDVTSLPPEFTRAGR